MTSTAKAVILPSWHFRHISEDLKTYATHVWLKKIMDLRNSMIAALNIHCIISLKYSASFWDE